jgi:hypothetical protein
MANTFKFGNGEWAVGKETALAYNDENSNFKPLPFTFDRASTATVVNKDGLIETVGTDEPRIDFLNNTKGHLLLEPQRTNKVTYSEDFSQWTDYNASAVLSEETIYGKKAYKIVEDSTLNYHGVFLSNLFGADGTNYIWSAYVKGAERRYVVLTARTGISSNASALIFDTQEGEWVLDASTQNEALFAENVGNGWWRIGIEGNPTSGSYDSYTIASAIGFSSYLDANYQGDGTSGFYVAMAQVEAGSYATSYIPTSGSTATRSAENTSQTPPDGVIGQTEGTIFVDVNLGESTINTSSTPIRFNLNNGVSTDNWVFVGVESGDNLRVYVRAGAVSSVDFIKNNVFPSSGNYKIAMSFKSNKTVCYVNGVLQYNADLGVVPNNLNSIGLGGAITNSAVNDKIEIKEYRLYDTALSDSELQALTS